MTRRLRTGIGHVLAALASITIAAAVARPVGAQTPAGHPRGEPMVSAIAEQLGVSAQPRPDDELGTGSSFTGVLKDPEKLSKYGVKGMHEGARVTIARVTPDKIRVEADEMEPAQKSAKATLKIDAGGRLVAPN